MKFTKSNIFMAVLALVIYMLAQQAENGIEANSSIASETSGSIMQAAFANHQSDLQIRAKGIVKKVLPDDRKGSQHQKFILQTSPDQTILVAHNIDVADRLPGLKQGDSVEFYGEYEWTAQGGVIHWTHRDHNGRHIDGWLKYNGKTYQ